MFTCQNIVELKREKYLSNDRPFNIDNRLLSSPLCAWCLSEQGLPAGEGSHGICSQHADQLLLEHRKLRSGNRMRKQLAGV